MQSYEPRKIPFISFCRYLWTFVSAAELNQVGKKCIHYLFISEYLKSITGWLVAQRGGVAARVSRLFLATMW